MAQLPEEMVQLSVEKVQLQKKLFKGGNGATVSRKIAATRGNSATTRANVAIPEEWSNYLWRLAATKGIVQLPEEWCNSENGATHSNKECNYLRKWRYYLWKWYNHMRKWINCLRK